MQVARLCHQGPHMNVYETSCCSANEWLCHSCISPLALEIQVVFGVIQLKL